MSDLLALLDQLDEARAKATPGPWVMDSQGCCVLGDASRGPHAEFVTNRSTSPPDAALIVAAVNAVPKLTAALRAVLAAAAEWEGTGDRTGVPHVSRRTVVSVLRGVIADALTPEATA